MEMDAKSAANTDTNIDTLSAALHVLAGDVCLQVSSDCFSRCRPFVVSDDFSSEPSKIDSEALSTWLCEGAHFFTLFKSNNSNSAGTLLFSHTNEVLYHASMDTQLSLECPLDVAFICQFTMDSLPEGLVPRLLAFDVLAPQSLNQSLNQPPNQPPNIRGDMLRALQGHLPQPLCCVQWIGPRQYLSPEFILMLPHRIMGLFSIGADPLVAGAFEAL